MIVVCFLTTYYFYQKLYVLENALFYGITLFLIVSLSIFVWIKTTCYFAVTFFNFLFITLHIVLFISPNSYITKAEVGICILYLSNMFKFIDFNHIIQRHDHLSTMLLHYHSLRWLFFWMFYSVADKNGRTNEVNIDRNNYEDFKK